MNSLSAYRFGPALDGAFLGAAAFVWLAAAQAAPPKVAFDVSYSVECHDVTPQEFDEANPDRKMIEARFQVSVLIRRGKEEDIEELMYVMWSPERRLQVVDFEPKNQMESEFTDPIQVVEKGENAVALDGSVKAEVNPGAGVQLSPTLGASKISKKNFEQKYSRLPPKQLLLSSGTIHRGHGVFFKLKPSSQASLEGRREFVCLFIVPKSWRADYAYVDCTAKPRNRSPWTKPEDNALKRVLVGLYLEGDAEAHEAAERLAYAHEAYLRAGGARSGVGTEPAREVRRFLRRLPGLSLVESALDDFAVEDQETSKKKHEAWKSFLAALEDLARFTG